MPDSEDSSYRDDIQQQLLVLTRTYEEDLPRQLAEIQRLWNALLESGGSVQAIEAFHARVHQIAGAGASFGFARLGARARELERLALSWLQSKLAPGRDEFAQVEVLLHQMNSIGPDRNSPPAGAPTVDRETGAPALIYVVEVDQDLAADIVMQLEHYGFRVNTFASVEEAAVASGHQPPQAVVIDVIGREGEFVGSDRIKALRNGETLDFNAVFLSSRDDFEARLAAVRAGADAYILKPLDFDLLLANLDRLTFRRKEPPYRILIVDDDTALAERYALILRRAGMEVMLVREPAQVLDLLNEQTPEMILLDLYIRGCNGLELAKVIRQQDRFINIPIIFLSTERDLERRFIELRMGGDEFLTKPIGDEQLIAAVSVRAARARTLNNLMLNDSLTGLLKHTKIKERLQTEMNRARRSGSPLSFAMIDVDHFKLINDVYGHLTGDRVIKGLGNLLRQRIRSSDLVGRYGGEEFAVVFPDCSVCHARRVLDRIRHDFAAISFRHGDEPFSVTFSAGVEQDDGRMTVEELVERADRLLYSAKSQGRNCVR